MLATTTSSSSDPGNLPSRPAGAAVCALLGAALLLVPCVSRADGPDHADVWLPAGGGAPVEAAGPAFGLSVSLLASGPAAEPREDGPRFSLFPAAPVAQAGPPPVPAWGNPPVESGWLPPREPMSKVRNWDQPTSRKWLRGTFLITGVEVASGVLLLVLPKSFTKWEDDPYKKAAEHLERAWTEPPVWDKDIFFHNWIGHPYVGAFYYNMLRSQGATTWQSFGFALFQSTLWEYVLEAVAEQPSIQDLILTPVAGSLLGELFHKWSLSILRSGRLNFGEKVLVFFLNPAYVVNNGFRAPE